MLSANIPECAQGSHLCQHAWVPFMHSCILMCTCVQAHVDRVHAGSHPHPRKSRAAHTHVVAHKASLAHSSSSPWAVWLQVECRLVGWLGRSHQPDSPAPCPGLGTVSLDWASAQDPTMPQMRGSHSRLKPATNARSTASPLVTDHGAAPVGTTRCQGACTGRGEQPGDGQR